MKKTLRNFVMWGTLGLATLMPMGKLSAQCPHDESTIETNTEAKTEEKKEKKEEEEKVNPKKTSRIHGNIEYIQSEHPENSYLRANIFYKLPKKIEGFTFLELDKNGDYFGKTYLDREIKKGFGFRAVGIHSGKLLRELGLGVNAVIPKTPKNIFANVGLIPLWIGSGRNEISLQYFASVDLPKGFNLSSFGEWDFSRGNGPEWDYGEFKLEKRFGSFFVGYNPALVGKGNAIPGLEHRATLGVNF
jgi:hypothetical protein